MQGRPAHCFHDPCRCKSMHVLFSDGRRLMFSFGMDLRGCGVQQVWISGGLEGHEG